jgi:hypothetical protein
MELELALFLLERGRGGRREEERGKRRSRMVVVQVRRVEK